MNLERLFNLTLSVSIASWAILGWIVGEPPRPVIVRGSIAGLHLVVAVLILIRSDAIAQGAMSDYLFALPAVLIGGWAFVFSPTDWPIHAQATLLVGAVIAVTSLFFLGRSFSILPAIRQVVRRGPYRWVRHPVYFGELIMVGGCCLAVNSWLAGLVFVITVALVAVRILTEEKLLATAATYRQYQTEIRWRLIPRVW